MHAVRQVGQRLCLTLALLCGILAPLGFMAPAQAAFPEANGWIAFMRQSDNGPSDRPQNVWVVDPRRPGEEVQLTFSGKDTQPAWCPDGQTLLFNSRRTSIFVEEVWAMNPDGSNQRKLSSGLSAFSPACSADSQNFAAASYNGSNMDIYVTDISTGNRQLLVATPFQDEHPSFSPDGRFIAWVTNDVVRDQTAGTTVSTTRLMIADADGTNPRVVREYSSTATDGTSNPFSQGNEVDWHPDSRSLEWRVGHANRGYHQRIALDGTILRDGFLGGMQWTASPNGNRMAGGLYRTFGVQEAPGIVMRDMTTGVITRLTNFQPDAAVAADFQQDWQPLQDTTRPVVRVTNPTEGMVIEQGSTVRVSYACTDEEHGSGIASCNADVANNAALDTSTVGDKSITVTARDNAGNETVATINYRVVPPPDTTRPTVTITSPADGAEFVQGSRVLADFTCGDDRLLASCNGTKNDGEPIDTSTLGAHTFEVTAADAAGNRRTVSVVYTVVAAPAPADTTKPTISVTSPAVNALIRIGTSATAAFTCSDAGSGIRSCVGTVANGAVLDTTTVGDQTLTVTAVDNAGNETVSAVPYRVIWPFGGFTGPVNPLPTVNTGKAGSVVPVKFSLGGDRGMSILATGYPRSVPITCDSTAEMDALEQTASPGGALLSYDAASDIYGYNWKTEKAWKGTCRQLVLKLADGATYRANFRLS